MVHRGLIKRETPVAALQGLGSRATAKKGSIDEVPVTKLEIQNERIVFGPRTLADLG